MSLPEGFKLPPGVQLPPMRMDNPTDTIIPLDGLPLTIAVVSIIFWFFSVIVVALRVFARASKGIFSWDDGFVAVGTVMYTAATGLSIYGVLVGLGRLGQDLNAWQQQESMKYYIVWILVYVVALATIKSSICATIMRIASNKINLRMTVYALLAITWASFFITFVGTLTYCQPVNAIWQPLLILTGQAKCAPVKTFIIIGHTATVSTIVTDLALVVVPAIILWNTQMKKQAKLQAFGLLSFASVASVITMIRIPYVNKFGQGTNLQFWVAHTMLCSNIETGIGCIASSLPSLRYFFRGDGTGSSSGPTAKRSVPTNDANLTIGSPMPNQRRWRDSFRNTSGAGFSRSTVQGKGGDSWERLTDGDSDRSDVAIDPTGIHKERSYRVDIEMKGMEKEKSSRM